MRTISSSNKSAHLGLNLWLGSDKPKREDFCQDNQLIDEAVGEHVADEVCHLSAQERQDYLRKPYTVGTYTGDGAQSRSIQLGYRPQLGFLFRAGGPAVAADCMNYNTDLFSAMFTSEYASLGVTVTDTGFTVQSLANFDPVTCLSPRLNQSGETYVYVIFH